LRKIRNMKRIAFLMMMLFAGFTFSACNNDDDDIAQVTSNCKLTDSYIISYPLLNNANQQLKNQINKGDGNFTHSVYEQS